MKIRITILSVLFIILNINVWGQDSISYRGFEDYPPVKELRCGLWINGLGDIAIKEQCPVEPLNFIGFRPPIIDSLGYITAAPDSNYIKMVDCYIIHTYNIQDSLNNADNDYISLLKNVVDTATFQILAPQYCKDKNNIYILQRMVYGSIMFANPYDKEFRVSEIDPSYAISSEDCFFLGSYIRGADPKTFEIIPVEGYALSRDKKNVYWNWNKMSDAEICEMEREFNIELFPKKHLEAYADSLLYVKEVPYIHNCNDPILWKIIEKGKSMIPLLINKLTDTRVLKEIYVPLFGGKYTVADVALVAIQEIIADVPVFELLDIEFSNDCGYCSYWFHVRENKKNRRKFQKAMSKWYEANKNNLIWVESVNSQIGDCFPPPIEGHYKVKEMAENFLADVFLSDMTEKSEKKYILKLAPTAHSNASCFEDSISFVKKWNEDYLENSQWFVLNKEKFSLKILQEFAEYAEASEQIDKYEWNPKAPVFGSKKYKNLKFISYDEIDKHVIERGYLEVSLPLFSKNGEYATVTVVSYTPHLGVLQVQESDDIYKRENNRWIKVAFFVREIS